MSLSFVLSWDVLPNLGAVCMNACLKSGSRLQGLGSEELSISHDTLPNSRSPEKWKALEGPGIRYSLYLVERQVGFQSVKSRDWLVLMLRYLLISSCPCILIPYMNNSLSFMKHHLLLLSFDEFRYLLTFSLLTFTLRRLFDFLLNLKLLLNSRVVTCRRSSISKLLFLSEKLGFAIFI